MRLTLSRTGSPGLVSEEATEQQLSAHDFGDRPLVAFPLYELVVTPKPVRRESQRLRLILT